MWTETTSGKYSKLNNKNVNGIFDVNPKKFNTFTPLTNIKILDEKMANYKELAMQTNMDIDDVRTKYNIYNDLKKSI